MKTITVVTGDSNKAREIAASIGAPVETASLDILEIQSLSVAEVARKRLSPLIARLASRLLLMTPA